MNTRSSPAIERPHTEIEVLANMIEHFVKQGERPNISDLGWQKILAALRSPDAADEAATYDLSGRRRRDTEGAGTVDEAATPQVSLKRMGLSDGRTDYFVMIKVGDREVSPHVFRDEYKAAYHVALYDWLLTGRGNEPEIVAFGPHDWPARSIHPAQCEGEPVAAALARRLCQLFDSGGESQRSVRARHASAIFQILSRDAPEYAAEQAKCDADPIGYLQSAEGVALSSTDQAGGK